MSPPQTNVASQALPPFDELVELAQQDPEAFSRFKREMCQEMILSASDGMQHRLWAQQSHIDLILSQCKNPDHANVTLMRELSLQMAKFRDALDGEIVEEKPSADVIPFRPTFESWR
ncbi:DUF3135 domain-containing protein [Vibrio furnissii]|uniref:DUF3135 domain-containing protein n=1 Tax=Vibrio furnissii TaxID=29494 RepID=UPI001559550B|nr:DUF3135 domain-containing protein [Vibrio furnissii]